jgi:CubicO group peptidase (beta-lactamase class C family)
MGVASAARAQAFARHLPVRVAVKRCSAFGASFVLALMSVSVAARASDLDARCPPRPGTLAAIDGYLAARQKALRIPGMALGIVSGDQVVHLSAFGRADATGRPVTAKTPFVIGSLSKAFTATAVLQLVDAGKLELDSPIQHYIPWFTLRDAEASKRITVRQLLNQTSGITTLSSQKRSTEGDRGATSIELRVASLRVDELGAAPGERFQYSGANYATLGLLVQLVSGERYGDYLRSHVFGPLGMNHSFTDEAEAMADGLTSGHLYWFGFPVETHLPFNRGSVPQGYVMSTAEDIAQFLLMQLNQGTAAGWSVLSPPAVREMQRPAVETNKPETFYGMGWEIGSTAGVPSLWHEGSVFNYHANMVLLPALRCGFVLLENAYSGPDEGRLNNLADGVTLLLTGSEPPSSSPNRALAVAYAVLAAIAFLQAATALWSLRRMQRRRALASPRSGWFGVVLSSLLNVAWALLVVLGIPALFGMPLLDTVVRIPDFGFVLLGSALVAVVWASLLPWLFLNAARR